MAVGSFLFLQEQIKDINNIPCHEPICMSCVNADGNASTKHNAVLHST
jgi:hypothetical protein